MAKERIYVRVDAGFFTHKKTNRIRRAAGDTAALFPLKLWTYASLNQSDGDFSDYSFAEIADILGIENGRHSQPAIKAVRALVDCGFCDPVEGYSENISRVVSSNMDDIKVNFVLHDWVQWNGFFFKGENAKSLGGYKTQHKNFLEKASRARTEAEREKWLIKANEMQARIDELSPNREEDTGTLPRELSPPKEQGSGDDPPPESERPRAGNTRPSSSKDSRQGTNQAGRNSTQSNGLVNGKNIHPYTRQKAIEELLKAPNLDPLEKANLKRQLANVRREIAGLPPLDETPKPKAIPAPKKAKEPAPEDWEKAAKALAKARKAMAV